MNASLHLHLMLLEPERIIGILALILVLLVIDLTFIIILHVLIVLMVVLLFMMSTTVQSLLLFHLLLGQLARHQVLPILLLPLVVLPRLFLLESLEAHPLFVAACLSLISQLLLNFFSPVQFSHVGNLFSLINFFAHKPVVHSLAPLVILFSFFFGNSEQFFLYFVLGLPDQLSLQSLFRIFGL